MGPCHLLRRAPGFPTAGCGAPTASSGATTAGCGAPTGGLPRTLAIWCVLLLSFASPARARSPLPPDSRARAAEAPATEAPPVGAGIGTEGWTSAGVQGATRTGLTVRWRADPGLEKLARRLARDSSWRRPLPGLGPPGALLRDTVTVWLVTDLDRVAGGDSRRERRREDERSGVREWVAGIAEPSRRMVAVEAGVAERGAGRVATLLRHELAHLALDAVAGRRAPRWLQEGYAQYASGSWSFERAWTLRLAFLRGDGPSLSAVSLDFPRDEIPARHAYLLSYTAVHELATLAGEPGLRGLFARMAEGAELETAMRDVFGISLGQFEDRWRRSVADRYGWLFLLSRASLFWIVIAVVVIVVYVRRRRHDRRRLQELRERERWRERIPDVGTGEWPRGPGSWSSPQSRGSG